MSVRRPLIVALLAVIFALPSSAYAFDYTSSSANNASGSSAAPAVTQDSPDVHSLGLRSPTYVPRGVSPNGVYTTPIAPGSKGTTATYNLDWTIGIAGKSGCLVCHADKNVVRVVAGQTLSVFVDTVVLQSSAHATLLCTDCHVDFAYKTTHAKTLAGENWRAVAKSSCKNCHQSEFLEWAKSYHSTGGSRGTTSEFGRPGSSAAGKPLPLCGDCHQGHSIPAKNDAAGRAAVHASGLAMCGGCHTQSSADYNDYYHGSAYRQGAPDAPACWQCHSTHLVLPSSDRQSPTNPDNLVTTCEQCHKNAGSGYVQYAPLIHSQKTLYQRNPIVSAVGTATTAITNAFNSVLSVLRIGGS
jgi:5-methylcytosine-specific restriction endonuclease McrA